MSPFCYTFAAAYIFWVVYTNIYMYCSILYAQYSDAYVVCLSRMKSLWITYYHRYLYTQPRKYRQLQMCNRRG